MVGFNLYNLALFNRLASSVESLYSCFHYLLIWQDAESSLSAFVVASYNWSDFGLLPLFSFFMRNSKSKSFLPKDILHKYFRFPLVG